MGFAAFRRDRSGSINILAAFSLPLVLGAAAFAVDLGAVYLDERQMQGASDLAALAAAAHPERAESIVAQVLEANGYGGAQYRIEFGRYEAEADVAPRERFSRGGGPFNALELTVEQRSPFYFARAFTSGDTGIGVRSVAAVDPKASFSIASRLASLRGGIVNDLLARTTGAELALSVMDANTLEDAALSPLALAAALSPADPAVAVLDRPVPLDAFVRALARASRAEGHLNAASLLDGMARALATGDATVIPADLVSFGTARAGFAVDTRQMNLDLNLLDILTTSLRSAAGTSAVRLTLDLGGLVSAEIEMLIGERARTTASNAIGPAGTRAQTAQLRARIRLTVGGALGAPLIELPVEIVAASASAVLTGATCPPGPGFARATLRVTPGIAKVEIAEWTGPIAEASMAPSRRAARVLKLPLAEITARSRVSLADMAPTSVVFAGAEIAASRVKTVATTDVVRSIGADLLANMELDMRVLGGLLPLSSPVEAVAERLSALAEPLDTLIEAMTSLAGIRLGEADVRVNDVDCSGAAIVG